MTELEAARLRVWRRRYVLIISTAGAVGIAGGLIAVEITQARHPDRGPLSWWVLLLIIGLPVVVMAATAVITWRTQARATAQRQIMSNATPASVRQLHRDLKAGVPLTAEQASLTQVLVDRPFKRWRLIVNIAIGLFWLGSAFAYGPDFDRWMRLSLGVAWAGLTVLLVLGRRLLLRRAAAHGITPDAGADSDR